MKIKCYPDNPYYQLLICLIIKFQITNIDANGSSLFSEDAKAEINAIVSAIKCILNNQQNKKYEYFLHEILDSDFSSLKKLSADAVRKLTYFNTADVPECALQLVYENEDLFVEDPVKAFVEENSIYNVLKDTIPRYLYLLAESMSKDTTAVNELWKNQPLKPIHLAVISGKKNILESIIKDENINQADAHGDTPLHYSCYWNHPSLTAYLLAANADVSLKNIEGELPIHHACLTGSIGSLKLLLKKNNQLISYRANNGWFPLFYSLIYTSDRKHYINIIELLRPFQNTTNTFEDMESFLYFLQELKAEIENSPISGKDTICNYLGKYLSALTIIEGAPNNFFKSIKIFAAIHIILLAIFLMVFFSITNAPTINQYWRYFLIPISTILLSAVLSTVYFLSKHKQNREIALSDALHNIEHVKLTEGNLFFSKSNQAEQQIVPKEDIPDNFSVVIPMEDELITPLPAYNLR